MEVADLVKLMEILGSNKNAQDKRHPYVIGKKYLIRTVTMIVLGELKEVYDDELIFKDASWVADTGRFYNALSEGKLNEVEPFINDAGVGRGAIIDFTEWNFNLPREQK